MPSAYTSESRDMQKGWKGIVSRCVSIDRQPRNKRLSGAIPIDDSRSGGGEIWAFLYRSVYPLAKPPIEGAVV